MNYPKNRYTGDKPWMDRDWLYNEYIVKDRRSKEIADEYGCAQSTIQTWLLKHKIKKPILTHHIEHTKNYQDKEFLIKEHIENHKPLSQIAKENDADIDTIRYFMKKYEIDTWRINEWEYVSEEEEKEFINLYTNLKMSTNQIGIIYNRSHRTVKRVLDKNGIKIRGFQEAQLNLGGKEMNELLLDEEYLKDLYWEQNKTCSEIGEILGGYSAGTIQRCLKRLNIDMKNRSQAKTGRMCGDKHPNWQGGITPLHLLLREYFHTNQVPEIAKRDNYTCQLCGKTHTILHVHHKITFSEIVKTIMSENQYIDITIPNGLTQMYQIITHDKRFLDKDNLITYCKECHFFKIHKYKQRDNQQPSLDFEEGSETIL